MPEDQLRVGGSQIRPAPTHTPDACALHVLCAPPCAQLCSQKELEFSQKYSASLDTFMNLVGFDITSDLTPPNAMHISVLVKEDIGSIVTDAMSLNLKKVRSPIVCCGGVLCVLRLRWRLIARC
jgi:hypothetical protein